MEEMKVKLTVASKLIGFMDADDKQDFHCKLTNVTTEKSSICPVEQIQRFFSIFLRRLVPISFAVARNPFLGKTLLALKTIKLIS